MVRDAVPNFRTIEMSPHGDYTILLQTASALLHVLWAFNIRYADSDVSDLSCLSENCRL